MGALIGYGHLKKQALFQLLNFSTGDYWVWALKMMLGADSDFYGNLISERSDKST